MADPFSIGGLILGLPGLVTACADLYKLTGKARNSTHDVNILICRVQVEQMKFAYWLEDVGFVKGSRPTLKLPPIAQSTLMNLLQSVKDTLTKLAKIIEKYELPGDVPKTRSITLPDRFWQLRIAEKPKSASPRLLNKASTMGKAMTWAAGQQEHAEKLLSDLERLNEGLIFVSGKLGTTGATMLPSRMLPHVWGEENLQNFIDATSQHQPELARCAEFKREVLELIKERDAQSVTQRLGKVPPLRLPPPRISKRRRAENSHLTIAEFSDKTTGKVEPVLLEEKSYANGPQPQYEKFVETRIGEVAAILSKNPKPAAIRVLDCIGYTSNRQDRNFSLVYRFPPDVVNDANPISLYKLLPVGPNGWDKRHRGSITANSPALAVKPSLRIRFTMAQSLSQSLALLQACGVLHKGITPANILFFQKQGESSVEGWGRDLSRPFLSGFTWARLHGSDFISDQAPSKDFASTSGLLHAHPAYSFNQEQRYLKVFDIYSLGLILLQIGVWRGLSDIADELFPSPKSLINNVGFKLDEVAETIESDADEWLRDKIITWQDQLMAQQQHVAQSDGIASRDSPRRSFQESLVQNVERLLLAEMGEIYTKVVARCLTGDIENYGMAKNIVDKISDENEPEYILQDTIVNHIVKELEKCNV